MTDVPVPVLVVDDDDDLRDALAETLGDAGFSVVGARNGKEALELLRSSRTRPSVILLDLMMPVMDGWTFLAEQRNDPELAGIPVLVLSAHPRLRELKAAQALTKPVDARALLKAIEQLSGASA